MSRLVFENQPAAPQFNTARADIACFAGLIRRLKGAVLSQGVSTWLSSLGYSSAQIAAIAQVPVPLDSWATFTSLFDDGSSGLGFGTDYVAATVRSFFAQGGRRCYVVRVGDPVTDTDLPADKGNKLTALLPGASYSPDKATTWTGVGNLAGLEDVSILVTPDLPVLCASQQVLAAGQLPTPPTGPEEFVECAQGDIVPQAFQTVPAPAPRLSTADYVNWANTVATILNFLSSGPLRHQLNLREVQFVAAFPLPQDLDPAAASENPSSAEIAKDIHAVIDAQMPETPPPFEAVVPGNISSAFVQLAYPWLKTTGSGLLLEQLEPPDGALAGLIARNALTRGTFTSATKIVPAEIYDIFPALPAEETKTSAVPLIWGGPNSPRKALIERLSLFGFTPGGLALLSDVTAYPGETYRSAPVKRLVAVISRAARRIGETSVFQSNGPALWGRVQRSLQNLMTRLWSLNALDGDSVKDAFSVRCDQSTMTQNDLDNGRCIALVTFQAAATVETIVIKLALETSGTSAQAIAANLAEAS
jgi:hypothetical protein